MPRTVAKPGSGSRSHITTACTACRRSKIKCDGQMPTCGQCSSKSRNCVFNTYPDRRRLSARKSIKIFSARVKQLQDFIISHGLEVPPPADQQNAYTLNSLMEAYPSSPMDAQASNSADIDVIPSPSLSHVQDPELMIQGDCPPLNHNGATFQDSSRDSASVFSLYHNSTASIDWSNDLSLANQPALDADWVWNMSAIGESSNHQRDLPTSAALTDLFASASGPPIYDVSHQPMDLDQFGSNITTDNEDHNEVTSQISERMGGLIANREGQWRFYGATSNLHLAKGRPASGNATKGHAQQASRNSARLKLFSVAQTVDADLVQHLINLYFSWHNASLHIVDQEYFEYGRVLNDRDHKQSAFYSDFLVNSMCAVGAGIETSSHGSLPVPLSEFFARRAKALLELELDEPKVATVQGLAILSCHEAGFMRDSRAWVLSGMAVRLAFDLGLHISTRKYVAEGAMSAEEANARNVAVWGCFMNDRGCGLYLGRPFHGRVEDIASDLPILNNSAGKTRLWMPVTHDDDETSNKQPLPNPENVLLERWILLHKVMSALGHQLYVCENATNFELQTLGQQTFERLQQWRADLPAELSLDFSALDEIRVLPHILVLHMHYALLVITLHRPFCSSHYIQPRPLVGRGPQHAREMCLQSAVDIAKLLTSYKRQYTLRRISIQMVHVTFTAALILVYATVSGISDAYRDDLTFHLDTCCEALSEFGEAFGSANRALDVLLAAKRSWQARMVTKV